MPELDRVVAGLRCRDVLSVLAEYVDGDLSPEQSQHVDEHLRGCDHCEKFGGEYGAVVAALRARLGPAVADQGVRARLRQRLDSARGEQAR